MSFELSDEQKGMKRPFHEFAEQKSPDVVLVLSRKL
jgi:hypothetical protein